MFDFIPLFPYRLNERPTGLTLPKKDFQPNMALKEKIIHESLKLFSKKGFLSTSIQDILDAANTSKGGLYNHFSSKEELFFAVLQEATRIWRERNLCGLNEVESPVGKLKKLLENYKDRYMKDTENFPGGCIFITLSVELDDQRPKLAQEITKGFTGFKMMIKRFLDQGKTGGEIGGNVDTEAVTEMILAGILGASVMYGSEKSSPILDHTINSLTNYIDNLAPDQGHLT